MTNMLAEQKGIVLPEDGEIQAMIEAGVHIGHAKNKRHPAMEPYIWTVRGGVSIIDLAKTKEKLAHASDFIKATSAKGGMILFVGTRPAAKPIIEETARFLGMPYVVERWIGGTLTNFKVIAKQVETLLSLEEMQRSGALDKYTKKERLGFEKKIERLKVDFDGLRLMNRMPEAIFVTNVPQETIAVREAHKTRIPVVALTDTNADPRMVSYPIPSNDDAKTAIKYMLERIRAIAEKGKEEGAGKETASG